MNSELGVIQDRRPTFMYWTWGKFMRSYHERLLANEKKRKPVSKENVTIKQSSYKEKMIKDIILVLQRIENLPLMIVTCKLHHAALRLQFSVRTQSLCYKRRQVAARTDRRQSLLLLPDVQFPRSQIVKEL